MSAGPPDVMDGDPEPTLPANTEELIAAFRAECHDRAGEVDPDDQQDWYSLTLGWAIAKGVEPLSAHALATHLRYTVGLG